MTVKDPDCDPKYIYQNLGTIKDVGNKIKYIGDIIEKCATPYTAPTTKKKRGMTGYNCYNSILYNKLKEDAKRENREPPSYIGMIRGKAWSQEEPKTKEHYNHLAKGGCIPRLL